MQTPSERIRELRRRRFLYEYAPAGTWRRIVYPLRYKDPAPAINYGPVIGTDERGRITYATGCRWVENASHGGLRLVVENATERANGRGTTGYYVDCHASETTHGAVLALPGRDGCALLVPAVADPWNRDHYLCDFGNLQTVMPGDCGASPSQYSFRADWNASLRDACHAADSLAEAYAEDCRDDDARQLAEQDIADCRETIANARQRIRALTAELRAVRLTPALCLAIRDRIASLRAESRAAWETIREREDNPWSAAPNY